MISVQPTILEINQLNTYIKSIIDGDINLSSIAVVGEISNFTNHYRTGHFYMTLKDEKSSIRAVMFKGANQRLRFMPENGMRVICFGRVSVFERDGQYQLYIEDMQPDGLGSLNMMFEQLKNKLEKEGLFSNEHKKPIPVMPSNVGVITSPTGAGLRDILNIIERRFPLCEVILAPVEVQGEKSAPGMIKALKQFDKLQCVDVIIIGRGGGAIEELWSFNDEELARTIFDVSIPVISAVGHETDFTICDFVADLRAPTPSAAAELAVVDKRELIKHILFLKESLKQLIENLIANEELKIKNLTALKSFIAPKQKIENEKQYLDTLTQKFDSSFSAFLNDKISKVESLYTKLDALNPLKVLLRGYSIAQKDNKLISKIEEVSVDDEISLVVSDGIINCKVIETESSL